MMYIFINGWETNLKFSAAHFIPYHSKCRRLHGHDYAIDIKISGEPVNGMVMDFVVIKKEIRKILESMDHRLILPLMNMYIISSFSFPSCLPTWSLEAWRAC